jgi:glycosyltransferase involved in cell wall biosynthesis
MAAESRRRPRAPDTGREGGGAVDPCLLIPIYDHGREIRDVVKALAPHALPCLIVDDGSHAETRGVLDALEREFPFVRVHRHERNRGKGEALKTGYRLARELGHTHAIQLDADGQHDAADVPRFVAAMSARPDALVLGAPRFDRSAPWIRMTARQVSRAAIWLFTLSGEVEDPLCGFRGIPIRPALARIDAVSTGSRMDFEPELVVRLVWDGIPVVSIPTRIVYNPGGLSHFDYVRDNQRLLGLYGRLLVGMLLRAPSLVGRRLAQPRR